MNGKCHRHGGLSTGPRTEEGKAKLREQGREHMKCMWEKWREEGRIPFTEETRKRLSEAMKSRIARKREAASDDLKELDWSLDDIDINFEPLDLDISLELDDMM